MATGSPYLKAVKDIQNLNTLEAKLRDPGKCQVKGLHCQLPLFTSFLRSSCHEERQETAEFHFLGT